MAVWVVSIKAKVKMDLTFEKEVEADSQSAAEELAEDQVDDTLLIEEIQKGDVVGMTTFDSTAKTDWKQCDSCEEYFEVLGEDDICEACTEAVADEDAEEDDEDGDAVEIEVPVK